MAKRKIQPNRRICINSTICRKCAVFQNEEMEQALDKIRNSNLSSRDKASIQSSIILYFRILSSSFFSSLREFKYNKCLSYGMYTCVRRLHFFVTLVGEKRTEVFPPKDCPYHLEHLVSTQKGRKRKKK